MPKLPNSFVSDYPATVALGGRYRRTRLLGRRKLFDGLSDAVCYRTHGEYAPGYTTQQRFMGKWGDGTPVKEPQVIVAE